MFLPFLGAKSISAAARTPAMTPPPSPRAHLLGLRREPRLPACAPPRHPPPKIQRKPKLQFVKQMNIYTGRGQMITGRSPAARLKARSNRQQELRISTEATLKPF